MEVTLKGVSKQFQTKHGTVTAVKDLSVKIASGKLLGFLGPSGCGKSTTLYMLAGIYELSSGQLLFDDRDVTKLPPEQRNIGMVFQNYALYPHLTVRENISFPLVNTPKVKKAIQQKLKAEGGKVSFKAYIDSCVQNAAKLVEITDYLDRKPAELSGGQQQRVAIARALVKRPSLLLLDEPLSNLDARLRLQTREEIRRIQLETGITTVFVTHDQEEALNICDEIVIMKDGVFQQQGTPKEVYENPANQFVAQFLGTPPINLLDGQTEDGWLMLGGSKWRSVPKDIANGNYKVGIRAENLFLTDDHAVQTLNATVLEAKKLGGASILTVQLADGQKLKLYYDVRSNIQPGTQVALTALDGSVCLFNEQGEKVLQW